MARWAGGRVSVEDSVRSHQPAAGKLLRDTFAASISSLTFGLFRASGDTLRLGPIELLRFGQPSVTPTAVEWPIEGGWAVGARGGTLRFESADGRLVGTVNGYRPRLPRPVYDLSQLPIHHLLTRLYLLRIAGRAPDLGPVAERSDRLQAAALDVAFCAALAGLSGRRPRLMTFLGITAAYHVACWSLSGTTLGGLAMKERVVATDGSRLSTGQALLRLLALPLSWIRGSPVHDGVAHTEVIHVGPPAPDASTGRRDSIQRVRRVGTGTFTR